MFFHTMKVKSNNDTEEYEDYTLLGFGRIDDKKYQQAFISADFTQIKTIKGIQYIAYYKKVCE